MPQDLFVPGVGLDVLGVEVSVAGPSPSRCAARTSRAEPGEEVSSISANWPTDAPRSVRRNPHSVWKLTSASTGPG